MTAEFTLDFSAGREARKQIEKAIRKGLQTAGTDVRRHYVKKISGPSGSRPGQPPGSRSRSERANDPIKPLKKLVKKQVKNNRGSPRLRVGFLHGKLDADEMRKANAVLHGRRNPTKRQGSRTDPRPASEPVFADTADRVAQAVFTAVKAAL